MNFYELSVKDIKNFINNVSVENYTKYIPSLAQDERQSIKQLVKTLKKRHNDYLAEQKRVEKLWYYENQLIRSGQEIIAGIDEAGRGPLAGPVVAAAVILPGNTFIEGINDSKKVSIKKREVLFETINNQALGIGVGIVDNHTIDKINILNATKKAMLQAIKNLPISPQHLLIDAVKLADIHIKQTSIVQGDSKSISIAAASIVAKVTRDRIMDAYHDKYPQYRFITHKGYGTKEHYHHIQCYGLTPIHRKSFLKNIMGDRTNED
ncbi:ribonuclease HII [Clostridiaceae bacterium 35-E11]